MSTFVFAIEGNENFSACGAICIASRSFTTCTDDDRGVLPVIAEVDRLDGYETPHLMHGGSFGAHALNAQRVFAMQRARLPPWEYLV
jgi:hypothetical protein